MSEKWPRELLLARHGQSTTNVRKQLVADARERGETIESAWAFTHQRDMDAELTEIGEKQGVALGKYLAPRYPARGVPTLSPAGDGNSANGGIEHIILSPYMRTRQTTECIVAGLGYRPNLVVEERVRELEFGLMDGLNREGVRLKYPDEAARRDRDGKYWYRPPGGENRPDVRLRVHSVLDTLNRDYVGSRVLIVCHSVVVLAFRSLIERWGEEQYMRVDQEDDVANCGLTRYTRTRNGKKFKLILTEYNTVAPTPAQELKDALSSPWG
jgi:broad specificity phosphatase PhoE